MWVQSPLSPDFVSGETMERAALASSRDVFELRRETGDVHSLVAEQSERQRVLLERLENPAAYPHPVTTIRRIETHISHVFLTGQFAYKIKKPVNLGFLDFSRLEQRAFYCREEFRLNRRLAPTLYLDVVPISDTKSDRCVGSADHVVEYAIKMLEFPQSSLLDYLLSQGVLSPAQIDALAERVAIFHREVARRSNAGKFGNAYAVWTDFSEVVVNLQGLLSQLDRPAEKLVLLRNIENWALHQFGRLQGALGERKRDGFIRECHGDLHLANIAWWQDEPQIFDGIEFSPRLRWIDVISELSFTCMDLSVRGRPDFGWRLLNRYLENSGDYGGLKLLAFYEVYRALVRAMVGCIRAAQDGELEGIGEAEPYFAYARHTMLPRKRMLILMHGVSGSGKTTVAQSVLETIGAIRIRSDVERKRLASLAATARCGSMLGGGIYDADSTYATYHRLLELARLILEAGYPVIIDAASLQGWQREIFRSEALRLGVPFRLLSCRAEDTALYERLRKRQLESSDASDAGPEILHHQQKNSEPLSAAERLECLVIDEQAETLEQVLRRLKKEVGL